MKLSALSDQAAAGLLQWSHDLIGDDLLFDGVGSLPQEWAWICFQLRASEDRPQWFPKGKWATIQFIEGELLAEAQREITAKVKP